MSCDKHIVKHPTQISTYLVRPGHSSTQFVRQPSNAVFHRPVSHYPKWGGFIHEGRQFQKSVWQLQHVTCQQNTRIKYKSVFSSTYLKIFITNIYCVVVLLYTVEQGFSAGVEFQVNEKEFYHGK